MERPKIGRFETFIIRHRRGQTWEDYSVQPDQLFRVWKIRKREFNQSLEGYGFKAVELIVVVYVDRVRTETVVESVECYNFT